MSNAFAKKSALSLGIIAVGILSFLVYPDKIIAETKSCLVNECKKEIYLDDAGRIFTYQLNRKFNVVLDKELFLIENLKCFGNQDAVIIEKTISFIDLYPNQTQRFIAKNPGTCLLKTGEFSVTIVVPEKENRIK